MTHKAKASLSEELSWYESNKRAWLESHSDKFVLIGGKTTVGFFDSYEKAFEAGLGAFGIGTDFLIKQVVEHEPVFVIY
jgi:hypothetical protein